MAGARPADSPRSCVSPAPSQELASTPEASSSKNSQLALDQPSLTVASFPGLKLGSGDETRLAHGAWGVVTAHDIKKSTDHSDC